ncbi:YihY family inner membrane protein [Nitrosovibrio sp. Nv17]|uniref:YihY family inner membrane protein n=1 Tax=Nitrosovibrio sp. Nv17 TaxID=1855339 RepID=UPI0009086DC7|nr:YihY family inner membrane protein [Nitrosovibrio sp. Nv17]SFW10693.1 tRNA-processing RNAse BN [Nitrosovibrio sp. Nv17]
MKSSRFLDFLHYVLLRFMQHNCTQVAASLTFTTLLSLVPLIAIGLSVVAAFPAFAGFSEQIKGFILTTMMPEAANRVIAVYVQQFADNAVQLTSIGTAFLGVTALALMLTIDKALNAIWRVTRLRPLHHRLLIYWATLTIGPLLIGASLSLTSWLIGLSMGVTGDIPGIKIALLQLVPLLLTSLAFSIPYLIVPNRRVAWRHAVAGGIAAAVGFEFMKQGFAFYITHFPTYQAVYGAFATIPIFLLWVYLSWLMVLLGAVIAASLGSWHFAEWRHEAAQGRRFVDTLRLLRVLTEAFRKGKVETYASLRTRLVLSFEEMEQILELMSRADWVQQVKAGGWVLAMDPARIKVADVYRLVVFRPDTMRAATKNDPALRHLLDGISAGMDQHIDMPLTSLLDEDVVQHAIPSATEGRGT